jgi:hypothetical protein
LPVVGLGGESEHRRRLGVLDLDYADRDPKEADVADGLLVQPVQGLAVLLTQLSLHNQDRVVGQVLAEKVQREAPNRMLGLC